MLFCIRAFREIMVLWHSNSLYQAHRQKGVHNAESQQYSCAWQVLGLI